MESYGLTPTAVTAITDMGTPISINLSDAPGPSPLSAAASSQDNTASTLYLLDRYGVSDEFYHELAQVRQLHVPTLVHTLLMQSLYKCDFEEHIRIIQTTQELPRLHHVKALRKDLNSQVDTIHMAKPHGKARSLATLIQNSQSSTWQSQVSGNTDSEQPVLSAEETSR